MLNDKIESYVELEMQSKQHLINDDFEAYINLQPSLQEKYLELLSILGGKEYDFFYHLFQNVKISENLLLDSSLNGIQGMIHEIKKSEYDSFFEDYFKIDISNVDIIRVSTMPDYAEGFASSCGEDNHYIVLPKFHSQLSVKQLHTIINFTIC